MMEDKRMGIESKKGGDDKVKGIGESWKHDETERRCKW